MKNEKQYRRKATSGGISGENDGVINDISEK